MQAMHKSFQEALKEHLRLRNTLQKCLWDFRHSLNGYAPSPGTLASEEARTFTTDRHPNFGSHRHDVRADLLDRSGNDQLPDHPLTACTSEDERQTCNDLGGGVAFSSLHLPINVRMIAHDLRAPLASAALSLQIARDSRTPPEKLEKALDLASKSLEVLGTLIDSLSGMSMDELPGDRLDLREYQPGELIDNAIDQVSLLAAQRNLHLSAVKPAKLPSLHCDGVKVTRVLVNLLSNAIKHTPEGGRILVEANKRNNDGHPAIVFSVVDNGPGICNELVERIFDAGISIATDGKPSTGLGLAFCREIVEAHLGRIWVDLERTGGATLSFAIPLDLEPMSKK